MARKRKRGTKSPPEPLVIHPDAAGIDIGATGIFVAVPTNRDETPVQSFPTFTQDLQALADWLQRCGITTVATESTGVYWIPLFQILETRGIEVCLVNAQIAPAHGSDSQSTRRARRGSFHRHPYPTTLTAWNKPQSRFRAGRILRAMAQWTKVVKVTWQPGTDSFGTHTVNILWATGAHGDGYSFDGPGGVLAHTFYPAPPNPEPIAGEMHFDDAECGRIGTNVDLFSVALHELGHALGLGHSDNPNDVMYPYDRARKPLSC